MSRFHILTGEHSRFRRWTLYIFARYVEMPLLAWSYRLLRGRYQRLGRTVLGWLVAAPFGYLGDTARPTPTPEVLRMIDALDGPIAVGPCRCRSGHGGCDHPLETDIVIRTGEFRVQSKIPKAYGSAWGIWMPHWLGIYWAGSVENGIHALPILSNGQTLWAGYLGRPVSYGCVVLATENAQRLYNWAEIGTPVSIRW